MVLAGLILGQLTYRIGCPMQEGDSWHYETEEILKTQRQYIRIQQNCVQTVLGIDAAGVQHIEVECTSGSLEQSLDGEKSDAEDLTGNSFNFFLNARGQEFQYEEIKATFEDDPMRYLKGILRTPADRTSIAPGETWTRRSKIVEARYKGLPLKRIGKYECIGLEQTGNLIAPFRGSFKVTQWYRTEGGRLQSETCTADDLVGERLPMLDYTFTFLAKEK